MISPPLAGLNTQIKVSVLVLPRSFLGLGSGHERVKRNFDLTAKRSAAHVILGEKACRILASGRLLLARIFVATSKPTNFAAFAFSYTGFGFRKASCLLKVR